MRGVSAHVPHPTCHVRGSQLCHSAVLAICPSDRQSAAKHKARRTQTLKTYSCFHIMCSGEFTPSGGGGIWCVHHLTWARIRPKKLVTVRERWRSTCRSDCWTDWTGCTWVNGAYEHQTDRLFCLFCWFLLYVQTTKLIIQTNAILLILFVYSVILQKEEGPVFTPPPVTDAAEGIVTLWLTVMRPFVLILIFSFSIATSSWRAQRKLGEHGTHMELCYRYVWLQEANRLTPSFIYAPICIRLWFHTRHRTARSGFKGLWRNKNKDAAESHGRFKKQKSANQTGTEPSAHI